MYNLLTTCIYTSITCNTNNIDYCKMEIAGAVALKDKHLVKLKIKHPG